MVMHSILSAMMTSKTSTHNNTNTLSHKTLDQWRAHFNQALNTVLQQNTKFPKTLHAAMQYTLLNGGKRLRPLLVYAAGRAFGASLSALDQAAIAVEYIHTYSLIHDDLPAMDNDDLRRGKPSCHKAFDEATAILTGDILQSEAFAILNQQHPDLSDQQRNQMVSTLTKGSSDMVAGQSLDLAAEGQALNLAELETIHQLKTGQLITSSILLGALAAPHCDSDSLALLRKFGERIGLTFQIQDDILDIESSSEQLGKPQGSDDERNKATYPKLLGLPAAKALAEKMLQEALSALEQLPQDTSLLKALAECMLSRAN